mmetsp:Transcript_95298/g.188895  ORF Transcript_95298/g.188895 Transcript_95298/m.188895 type:complete len:436 (-) Transcript_95298:33-1340(-)
MQSPMRALLALGFQAQVASAAVQIPFDSSKHLTLGQSSFQSVRNLRFDDTDPDAGQVAGVISWEQPAVGTRGFGFYAAYFSTSHEAGGTETMVEHEVIVGSLTSELIVSENTPIPTGAQYLLLYLLDGDHQKNLTTLAYACLKDKHNGINDGYARMVYFTTKGYEKADAARTYLATQPVCASQPHNIIIEMVATVYYNSAKIVRTEALEVEDFDYSDGLEADCGAPHWPNCTEPHVCIGGDCHSSTATFLVKFPSGNGFASLESGLTSNGFLLNSAVPPFYSGKGTSPGTYTIGTVAVSSEMLSSFSPCRDSPPTMSSEHCGYTPLQSDPDIGWKLCKSLVYFHMALAAVTNQFGDVILLSKDDKKDAVSALQNVWISYRNTSFVDAASAGLIQGYMGAHMGAVSRARCWQVTGVDYHPDCTCPDFPDCGITFPD